MIKLTLLCVFYNVYNNCLLITVNIYQKFLMLRHQNVNFKQIVVLCIRIQFHYNFNKIYHDFD